MVTITYTEQQEKALNYLTKFNDSEEQKYFKLQGYAGTGKSFLITQFIKTLKGLNPSIKVCVACPTNKAKKNIANMNYALAKQVDLLTVAQLLKKFPVMDEDKGKQIFASKLDEIDFTVYDLIIIDEYSMIGNNTLEQLFTHSDGVCKLIFVGDGGQLPPVSEGMSNLVPVDISNKIRASFNLKEVVRNGGELLETSLKIRKMSNSKLKNFRFSSSSDETIKVIDNQYFLDSIPIFFPENYIDDVDQARVLVWRNATAFKVNSKIREEFFGRNAPLFCINDLLITKKPCFNSIGEPILDNSDEVIVVREPIPLVHTIVTDDKVNINGLPAKKIPEVLELSYFELRVETVIDGRKAVIFVLDIQSKKKFDKYIRALIDFKVWRSYYDVVDVFHDVVHAYCLSTHKSQGSTFDNVIIAKSDLKACTALYKRLLYTAMTRARNTAYIIQ